ncbi:MAG TPA: flagellar biosynthesis anti-sigma factor FlgM [Burkholderiaceae bacterium]|jgi:negative regulator of flagellin synthesis FlgM|nr:flagellar biosynthesis anti-sigma factor FlgM [Burkholderiaceae bacterium]
MNNVGQINSTPAIDAINAQDRKSQASTRAPASAPSAAVESSTQVAISPEASALSEASDDPTFDAAKVASMQKQIQDGTFKVNAGNIADKMLATAQETLQRGNSSH